MRTKNLAVGIIFIFGIASAIWWLRHRGHTEEPTVEEINVYNWSYYISEDVLRAFTKKTGILVHYDTYASNEEMLAKIENGASYDIVVPSDYMVALMKRKSLLLTIDQAAVPNLKNLDPRIVKQAGAYDAGHQFVVPYMWGTVGIGYNDSKLPSPPRSVADLLDTSLKQKISIIDDPRFVIGMILKSKGLSANSQNINDLSVVQDFLTKLKPSILDVHSEHYISEMENEEAWAAIGFPGDIYQASDKNNHIHYIVPPSGTVLWVDNIAIPKYARNKKAALAFINFLLEPENAAEISNKTKYASANKAAQMYINREIINNPNIYLPADLFEHCEVLRDLGDAGNRTYEAIWLKFKQL